LYLIFSFYRVLCPEIPSEDGRALYASYSLRKIEASLLAGGFTEDEVIVALPDKLHRVIGEETRVVGITTVDPRATHPSPTRFVAYSAAENHAQQQNLKSS